MKGMRHAVAASVMVAAAGAFAVGAAADGAGTHGNRLKITFEETRLAIQEPPGLNMRQVIGSGTGTFEGYGAATELVAVSQDHAVTPCGPGSSTSTILRRIIVPQGTLVVKSLGHRCPAPFGILATAQYEVDGAASTGVFADARGHGSDIIRIEPPPDGRVVATLSGKLNLAG